MSRILHREIDRRYPAAVRGRGVYLYDADGRAYIDASGGAAVSCLGHAHPDVLAAMHGQLERIAYAHTSFFTTEVAEALAAELVRQAPHGLSHAYFLSGGSEAIEAALKMARQYFVERGQPERRLYVARRQSYHGGTLGALAVGGNTARRAAFAPILAPAHHVAPCYEYRHRRADETPAAYGRRTADELEAKILELGERNVIAFVAETVAGAALGAVPPAPGYFRRVREICDRYGVLLILDEVMCGMGRTGTLHACAQEEVSPDLLVLAKGLTAGYAPAGAVLLHRRIHDAFAAGAGAFLHGHTYSGHPLACAAALAVQRVIRDERLLENVRARGAQLQDALHARFARHPHVGDIRGRGLFWGLELVADRGSKTPFPAARRTHARVKAQAFTRGLLVYPMGGTADGRLGDHVLLAPPFICTEEIIASIVERLGEAVDAATSAAVDAAAAV